MKVFNHYAQYYDLLYSAKEYDIEANYVDGLIKKHCPSAKEILDLGCGTGTHDFYFEKKGYEIIGVDLSDNMISIAKEKQIKLGLNNTTFLQGDLRTVDLDRQFDVVVSLFHVMNYLNSNRDMYKGFKNAIKHVKNGGVFIFDCWYGPAVLTDLPKIGIRRLQNDKIKTTRIVEPHIYPNKNVVDVNYEIFIEEIETSRLAVIKETHSVRYFFRNEIQTLFKELGVEIISEEEWVTSKEIGVDTFSACFVARKCK